ncbi:MAG TPA: chemotaxis protein CheW [Aquirhabdus sp.]
MAAKGFIQLLRLSERGRQRIRRGQESQEERWSGVGFVLAGQQYIAPLGEVAEVLRVPEYTSVHGVHHWLFGLSNVRGRLLPLIDLAEFTNVTREVSPDSAKRKIIVIDHGDLFSGLLVDEVLGIQHFSRHSYAAQVSNQPSGIQPYLHGGFNRTDQFWQIFMLSKLAADPRYLSASL